MILWTMGVNQSTVGTLKNRAIINLCLATGNVGKPGTGPFSLTGQPNAMGGRETGGLSQLLPGYRLVENPRHRKEVERYWHIEPGSISKKPGLSATALFRALDEGSVKFLWVVATNPAVSIPDLARVRRGLSRAKFLVVQDAYPTETTRFADVVLPAAGWGEKRGTMTNSERRVSLVEEIVEPPGEARADWEIFAEAGRKLGFDKGFAWEDTAEIYAEYKELTRGRPAEVTGLSHERLRRGPVQWPVTDLLPRADAACGALRAALCGVSPRTLHRPHKEPVAHHDPDRALGEAYARPRRAVRRDKPEGRVAGGSKERRESPRGLGSRVIRSPGGC